MNKFLCTLTFLFSLACQTGRAISHAPSPVRASFYARKFEGRLMADGKPFSESAIFAASLAFPVGTRIKVTNVKTGKSVCMTVTDGGPWHTRFKLDLSLAAFRALGFKEKSGWGWVTVEKVQV